MKTKVAVKTTADNLAELVRQLGDVPLDRILLHPAPGTATENDAIALLEAVNKRLVELVQGVLIEKAPGLQGSCLSAVLIHLLWKHLEAERLGIILGGDGAFRLRRGLIRLPAVSFIPWTRLPRQRVPDEPTCRRMPSLIVEMFNFGNTERELQRKLQEYFEAGVELAWVIQPKLKTAEIYTASGERQRLRRNQALHGGAVLPGFRLGLPELFAHLHKPT